MSEVKKLSLKRRELVIDAYGDSTEKLRFPSLDESEDYQVAVLKPKANEVKVTKEFLKKMGMKIKTIKILELPDMVEIMAILTGVKKN